MIIMMSKSNNFNLILFFNSFIFQINPFYKMSIDFFIIVYSLLLTILGKLNRITIQPGRTLKVIGTVTGPLKKYVGKNFHLKFLQYLINFLF